MGGSSLWLVPAEGSRLYRVLQDLILHSIPSLLPSGHAPPSFIPHVTLTSDVVIEGEDPQSWLDAMTLPDGMEDLRIVIEEPVVGNAFVRKLTLRCNKNEGLKSLASACRVAGLRKDSTSVEEWAEHLFWPHLSLLYSHLPADLISTRMSAIQSLLQEAKSALKQGASEGLASEVSKGGSIVLVPTYRPISEWQSIAIRELENVEWTFEDH